MTFSPRARAADIAATIAMKATFAETEQVGPTIQRLAESALLAFAKEVLTPQREKDTAVMHMTAMLCALPEDDHGRISRESAMELVMQWRMKWDAANRAKSLEDS